MSTPDLNMRWQDQNVVKKDGQWTVDGRPVVDAKVAFHHRPSNLEGKSWLGLLVTAPPNAATPPHTHAGAAISATVIRGKILNQMIHPGHETASPAKVYGPGDSWFEAPGCRHVRSETVGDEEVVFIANFVVGDEVFEGLGDQPGELERIGRVFVIDKDVEESKGN